MADLNNISDDQYTRVLSDRAYRQEFAQGLRGPIGVVGIVCEPSESIQGGYKRAMSTHCVDDTALTLLIRVYPVTFRFAKTPHEFLSLLEDHEFIHVGDLTPERATMRKATIAELKSGAQGARRFDLLRMLDIDDTVTEIKAFRHQLRRMQYRRGISADFQEVVTYFAQNWEEGLEKLSHASPESLQPFLAQAHAEIDEFTKKLE